MNVYFFGIIKTKRDGSMVKYKENEIITGCVTGIEKYGIFVGFDEYYSGLIHISEISDDFVKNINSYVKIGETIKVRILDIDEKSYHLKLSIKNLNYKVVKKKRQKIVETINGFQPLKDNLGTWIDKKYKEILKNNKN